MQIQTQIQIQIQCNHKLNLLLSQFVLRIGNKPHLSPFPDTTRYRYKEKQKSQTQIKAETDKSSRIVSKIAMNQSYPPVVPHFSFRSSVQIYKMDFALWMIIDDNPPNLMDA